MSEATTEAPYQRWGYKPDGSQRLFTLEQGDPLPDGWMTLPEANAEAERLAAAKKAEADEKEAAKVSNVDAAIVALQASLVELGRRIDALEAAMTAPEPKRGPRRPRKEDSDNG